MGVDQSSISDSSRYTGFVVNLHGRTVLYSFLFRWFVKSFELKQAFTSLKGARTATGIHKDIVPINPSSHPSGVPLSQLADLLSERHPNTDLKDVLRTSSWSVNEEMVDEEDVPSTVLTGGEEV